MGAGDWEELLCERVEKKWDSFSWITLRALISSVNHVINLGAPNLVGDLRTEWNKAHRVAKTDLWDEHRVVRRPGNAKFIVLGDPGEQDASQYVLVPALRELKDDMAFMVIMSDVIYPSGDVNDYVDGFYIPYGQLCGLPIYALPGNHDWYDGLAGFMWHFCDFPPLPRSAYGTTSRNPLEWLCRLLWRQPSKPRPHLKLPEKREERRLPHEPAWRPLQPGSYFAIDIDHLRIVCIDSGIKGEIDPDQARWLLEVSQDRARPKLLLTGKPLVVNHAIERCKIRGGPVDHQGRSYHSVYDIVTRREHGYVATVGGDIHNYQRYPGPNLVAGGGGAYMSATHPVAVAKDGRCSKAAEADAIELYPTAADSLALMARILLPKIWRLERALIAALLGLAAATVWTQVTDDRDALRMSLLWGAVALAPFLLLRAVIPANATKRRWYRALAVLESFMAGAVVGLAGWWLAPGRFVTNVGWAAGLAVGGGVLALLLRATGWWRPYEEGLEISATARRLAGLALAALGAGSVAAALATHTWQIAVAGLTLSVAAHIGWRMRGAPGSTRGCWWRFGAQGTAYVAQLVAVLFLLDAFVVPDRTHDALWAAVAGLPGGLLLMLLVGVPLLFVLWAGPAWGAGRLKGVHIGGGWGVIGRFVRGSLWLAMAGFVFGYWHLLDLIGVGTESRRAAITAFMTVVVPVAAVFALDSVRRRTRAGLVYKVAAAALIAAVAAPVTLWAGGTWVPHAIVAGAVLLAVVLAGVVIAHLTFLGAPALLCDCHAHRDREQLSLAEADSVIEWRRGGEAPKDRRVRRRANIVFPGATRPWGPLQKKIAEVCDVDEPPFFRKGFLTVDAREDGLTIQPYEVTGEGPTTSTPGEPIHVEYGTL